SSCQRRGKWNSAELRPAARPLLVRRLTEQDLGYQEDSADHNRAVGHVECRPMIGTEIKIEEVHYVAAEQPVPQIANCSAQNERQAHARGTHHVAVLTQ